MSTCDICGNDLPAEAMQRFPSSLMSTLSKQAFVPKHLPRVIQDMVSADTSLEALWKMTVSVNETDWGLCPSCAAEVREFSAATKESNRTLVTPTRNNQPSQAASERIAAFFGGILLGSIVIILLVYVFGTLAAPFTDELDLSDIYSWSGMRWIALGGLGAGFIIGIVLAFADTSDKQELTTAATPVTSPAANVSSFFVKSSDSLSTSNTPIAGDFLIPGNITVIIAFFLQPQETPGGQAEFIGDLSGEGQWKQKLLDELGLKGVEVRLFTEDQWRMPQIRSADGIYDQKSLADIVGSMAIALDELGVADEVVKKYIQGDFENLRRPTSGRVILFQAIEAPRSHLGRLLEPGKPAVAGTRKLAPGTTGTSCDSPPEQALREPAIDPIEADPTSKSGTVGFQMSDIERRVIDRTTWPRSGASIDEKATEQLAAILGEGSMRIHRRVNVFDPADALPSPGSFVFWSINGMAVVVAVVPDGIDGLNNMLSNIEAGFFELRTQVQAYDTFPVMYSRLLLPTVTGLDRNSDGEIKMQLHGLVLESAGDFTNADFQDWLIAIKKTKHTQLQVFDEDGNKLAIGERELLATTIATYVLGFDQSAAMLESIASHHRDFRTAATQLYRDFPEATWPA